MKALPFFVLFIFFLHNSLTWAQEDCEPFFQKSKPIAHTEVSLYFPPELHLKPEAINYLLKTEHAPLLRALSKAFTLHPFLFKYLPVSLKHSIFLSGSEVLPVPASPDYLPSEIDSIEFQRAYTAIKNLSMNLVEAEYLSPQTNIDQETLLVVAKLTEKLVPVSPPPIFYTTSFDKMWKQLQQTLPQILKNRNARDVWKELIQDGIHLTQIVSMHEGRQHSAQYSSLERFEQLLDRLKKNSLFSQRDAIPLIGLSFKLFSSILERQQKLPEHPALIDEPIVVTRREFLGSLLEDLSFLSEEKISPAIEMFDQLYFRTSPPASELTLHQQMVESAKTLLFTAKSDFAQWSKQKAMDAKAPLSTHLFTNHPSLNPVAPSINPLIKKRIKTRGNVQSIERDLQPKLNESPLLQTELHTLDTDLQAGKPYPLTFKRSHTHLGGTQQIFVFQLEVAEWLKQNPALGDQFFKSIQMGPTSNRSGQAGIKLLQIVPKTIPGRLYEVKIRGKYRMILQFYDGVWTALSVVDKDYFSTHIRTW